MSVWPSVWMAAIVSLMMRSGSSCSARVICASVILKMSDGESNLSSSSALIADMPQGDVWMCNWGFSNSVTKQVYRICVHALRTGRFAENAPFSVCAWNRISKRALFQRFGATWWWQHNARLTRQMLNVTGYYNVRPIKKKIALWRQNLPIIAAGNCMHDLAFDLIVKFAGFLTHAVSSLDRGYNGLPLRPLNVWKLY